MLPIEFAQCNKTFVGPDGSGILPLPAYNGNGHTVTCWALSPEELAEVNRTGNIWLSVHAGETTPPVCPMAYAPFYNHPEALHDVFYCNITNASKPGKWIWNHRDAAAPKMLKIDGEVYLRDVSQASKFVAVKVQPVGSYYIRETQPGPEREAFGEEVALVYIGAAFLEGLLPIPKETSPAKIIPLGE